MPEKIPNLIQNGVAIFHFTYASEPNCLEYWVGGELDENRADGYQQIILDEGRYYACSFETENFEHLVTGALYKENICFFDI